MATLQITQTTDRAGRYRVELSLYGDGLAPQNASTSFRFEVSPQDQEDLRWYLEDYLQFPYDPATAIAARIERRMKEIGADLFRAVFESSTQSVRLWSKIYERTSDLRVEIITSVGQAATIPWELLRDPHTDTVLALTARAFVHTHREAAVTPKLLEATSGPIRILLVICRPMQGADVPFRSVASRLVNAISGGSHAVIRLDVLRPPTYDQFAKTLRQAKREGRPYHVVHFDGHGMYAQLSEDHGAERASAWLTKLIPLMLGGAREGSHGYLLFENPANDQNLQLVDGGTLGRLLYETNTPLLVLNACRSAHADVLVRPKHADTSDELHTLVRAYGSLAQEVIDAGVTGVVAMRYSVYVVTAAQFVADLYSALVQGSTLGEAVTIGRKQLFDNPDRAIVFAPRPLQDWCVPLVYETTPTRLFKPTTETQPLPIKVEIGKSSVTADTLDRALPLPPDVGFFGRDETLLALDRAFDSQSIVLLHGFAGSGKTATAVEFARWYSLTGGVSGPVLFTTFEQYHPLVRILDRVGQVFRPVLEQSGVNWLALDDDDRRDVAIQVLKQVPLLWIWDNVEQVTRFPIRRTPESGDNAEGVGNPRYSEEGQRGLADFLRHVAQTKAKILLTSRRDEREWLGDNLPNRILIPSMPMQERMQLTRAIVQRQGRIITDVDDWRPLLRFTDGNPLTIIVLVGQALRDGLKTREEIEAFVDRLRSGESEFFGDDNEGRDRSLRASLSYGFHHAFNRDELKKLAVLSVFNETVEAALICEMGNPEKPYCLSELKGIQENEISQLLVRAAEIGLVRCVDNVVASAKNKCFFLHPAVPWFLRKLAVEFATDVDLRATRAFVEAMAWCAQSMVQWCNSGHPMALYTLAHHETNSRRAFDLAVSRQWVEPLEKIVGGLLYLYADTGRWPEINGLINSLLPYVCSDSGEFPRSGWESVWATMTESRAIVTAKSGDVHRAERFQSQLVSFRRESAANALTKTDPCADVDDENRLRGLASALSTLANLQREIDVTKSNTTYKEAIELARRIKDPVLEGRGWLQLGIMQLAVAHQFDEAESSFNRALDLFPPGGNFDRSKVLYELGMLWKVRHEMALREANHVHQLRMYLDAARRNLEAAISETPQYAAESLALRHGGLAAVYRDLGELSAALEHGKDAIQYDELCGDVPRAAYHRLDVAQILAQMGRLADALDFARAARDGFRRSVRREMLDEIDQLLLRLQAGLSASKEGLSFGGQYLIGINELVVPRRQAIETIKQFDSKQHLRGGQEVSEKHATCSIFSKVFGEDRHQHTVLVLTFDLLHVRGVFAAFRIYGLSSDSPLSLLKVFLQTYGVDMSLNGVSGQRLVQGMEFRAPAWVQNQKDLDDAIKLALKPLPRDDQPGWIDMGLAYDALTEGKCRIELAFAVYRRGYGLDLRRHGVDVPVDLIPDSKG